MNIEWKQELKKPEEILRKVGLVFRPLFLVENNQLNKGRKSFKIIYLRLIYFSEPHNPRFSTTHPVPVAPSTPSSPIVGVGSWAMVSSFYPRIGHTSPPCITERLVHIFFTDWLHQLNHVMWLVSHRLITHCPSYYPHYIESQLT